MIREMKNAVRMAVTRGLIRLAMKTCVMGFCLDHLEAALEAERRGW